MLTFFLEMNSLRNYCIIRMDVLCIELWDFKVILLIKMKIPLKGNSCVFLINFQVTFINSFKYCIRFFLSKVTSTEFEREWWCAIDMPSYLNNQTNLSDLSNCYPFQVPNRCTIGILIKRVENWLPTRDCVYGSHQ